jgi:hypothetical protein
MRVMQNESGLLNCARCGHRKSGERWDLGHRDDSNHTEYSGPEHRRLTDTTSFRGKPTLAMTT